MTDLAQWFATPPYSLAKEEKSARLTAALAELTQHHYDNCEQYRNILNAISFEMKQISSVRH